MYLNRKIAVNIIKEISSVTSLNLNIMDSTGLILASTDPNRIDTYHEGAHILIQKKIEEFIVKDDDEYKGCKKGINLPINFASEVVGVIGITGEPQEIIRYGRIIKKVTEMIVREKFEAAQKSLDEQAKLIFVNNLVHGNFDVSFFNIENGFKQYGLQTQGPYCTAISKLIYANQEETNDELYKAKQNIIYKYVLDKFKTKYTIAVFRGDYLIVIFNLSADKTYEFMDDLYKELNSIYDISLLCSIGNAYSDYMDIPRSYNEANSIINYFDNVEKGVFIFNNVLLDFTVNQIPSLHKKNMFDQVFKHCTSDEVKEFSDFIIAYFENNGSLAKLSNKYIMHKNTVQYKIQKIFKKTTLDMRQLHDMFILYIAAICR